jgi:hypothetical protein
MIAYVSYVDRDFAWNRATFDAKGHRVDCERLLLPPGEGSTVQQIVASLQLISIKGRI